MAGHQAPAVNTSMAGNLLSKQHKRPNLPENCIATCQYACPRKNGTKPTQEDIERETTLLLQSKRERTLLLKGIGAWAIMAGNDEGAQDLELGDHCRN